MTLLSSPAHGSTDIASAASADIELYTYALSPFGMKVYWALQLKRLPFVLHYVHPVTQREIRFTKQKIVPVLKIGKDWMLDSTPICIWLDEQFPTRPIAGVDKNERARILNADNWVTDNVIPLAFRSATEKSADRIAFRNGRKLYGAIRDTSGGIPSFMQYIWPLMVRRVRYVKRNLAKLDANAPISEVRSHIEQDFVRRVSETGFLGRTSSASIADISAFAQITMAESLGMEGQLRASHPVIASWMEIMRELMPDDPRPALIPNRDLLRRSR